MSVSSLIPVIGALVAVAAAIRSTWSPCGLSMLSTITPFGERSRGHRYASTATWFVVGATAGGACLGAAAAGLAGAVSALGLAAHPGWSAGAVAVLASAAAATDAGLFGQVIPLWRRQVDDGWLRRYRSWVYGAGFGWQIGVGLATYIMTAAVFLVVGLAVVSANPLAAMAICTLFGFLRGLAVFVTAGADSPARLRVLHRWFDRAGPAVRFGVIGVEVGAVVSVLAVEWPWAGAAVGLATAAAALAALARARSRSTGAPAGARIRASRP